MKVTATTLPRRSLRASRAPSCVVRLNAGAGPIFGRSPLLPAAWLSESASQPTTASVRRLIPGHLLHMCTLSPSMSAASSPLPRFAPFLSLHLLLQLVEETPLGALGDDLLWARRDHPGLVQTQRIEAHRVFGIILAPAVIGDLLHRLQGIIVAWCEASLYDEPGSALGLEGTNIGRLQDRTQRPFGGHRMLADKLPAAGRNAAEVLRPGSVHGAVDDHIANLLCPQFLWHWRKANQRVNLPLGEELCGLGWGMRHPVNVLLRVQAHVHYHAGEEGVV